MDHAHTIKVRIENAPTRLRLGVSEAERATPQEVRVDVTLDLAPAAIEDDLAATVDYDQVIGFIRSGLPALGPIRLIETVADSVARAALELSPRVLAVEVRVRKPRVLEGAGGMVSVALVRRRAEGAP